MQIICGCLQKTMYLCRQNPVEVLSINISIAGNNYAGGVILANL